LLLEQSFFMNIRRLIVIGMCVMALGVHAQRARELTPALLLSSGQYELKLFHNLYTQTYWYDEQGRKAFTGERSTFFTTIGEWRTGWKARWNIGLMAFFRSVRYDLPDSSPFSVLALTNEGTMARTALTHMGATVRWLPFSNSRYTSVKASLLLPLARNLQGPPYLEHDGFHLWLQWLYDRQLAYHWQLYAEAGLWARIDRRWRASNSYAVVPLKAFLSWLPNDHFIAYVFAEWSSVPTELLGNYYVQTGAGLKWYPVGHFELELMSSAFVAGAKNGAGYTLNLGWRLVW